MWEAELQSIRQVQHKHHYQRDLCTVMGDDSTSPKIEALPSTILYSHIGPFRNSADLHGSAYTEPKYPTGYNLTKGVRSCGVGENCSRGAGLGFTGGALVAWMALGS